MKLTKQVVKNLLDIARFDNLAVTAISLGLLSNVLIAINDISSKAREDLHELRRILKQSGDYTVDTLIFDAAQARKHELPKEWRISMLLDKNHVYLPSPIQIFVLIPGVVHPDISTGIESGDTFIGSRRIKDLDDGALGHCRSLWDVLAANRQSFIVTPSPKHVFVEFEHSFPGLHEVQSAGNGLHFEVTMSDVVVTPSSSQQDEYYRLADPLHKDVADEQHSLVSFQWPADVTLIDRENPQFGHGNFHGPGSVGMLNAFRSFFCELPTTAINSDPLTYLLKKVDNVEHKLFRAESFAEAFPSLSKWAAHYDTLKLDDLDIVLGEQSKQSRGELEIFGAKIPNELVAWIGLPVFAASVAPVQLHVSPPPEECRAAEHQSGFQLVTFIQGIRLFHFSGLRQCVRFRSWPLC
jgi:hypothetical protein